MQWYISLHREIQDHWIYQEKRIFSRYEAWLDMLMLANHADSRFVHWSELLFVKRGSFVSSELKLMERWSWSKTKARSFFSLLEQDKMIEKISDSKKTTFVVLNYNKYQVYETREKPEKNWWETGEKPEKDTNNNDNNANNENTSTKEILSYWNSKKIIVHEKNQKLEWIIKTALNQFSVDQIKIWIDTYSEVLLNDKYLWSYKWWLSEFLSRKNWLLVFMDKKPEDYPIKNSYWKPEKKSLTQIAAENPDFF